MINKYSLVNTGSIFIKERERLRKTVNRPEHFKELSQHDTKTSAKRHYGGQLNRTCSSLKNYKKKAILMNLTSRNDRIEYFVIIFRNKIYEI